METRKAIKDNDTDQLEKDLKALVSRIKSENTVLNKILKQLKDDSDPAVLKKAKKL